MTVIPRSSCFFCVVPRFTDQMAVVPGRRSGRNVGGGSDPLGSDRRYREYSGKAFDPIGSGRGGGAEHAWLHARWFARSNSASAPSFLHHPFAILDFFSTMLPGSPEAHRSPGRWGKLCGLGAPVIEGMGMPRTMPTLDAIQHGDCLDRLPEVHPGSIDLAYIDPPFATGKRQQGRHGHAYEDRWPSIGVWLEFMRPRLEAVLATLTATGTILLHCDWRTSHHLRVLLEELLGPDHFQNHLVWQYGLGGSSPRRFARKHDDILFYTMSSKSWYFDPPMVPATSQRMRGRMKKATDVLDVPSINNMARERTGWPTQKPIVLLDLLVRACCPPGGTVLDPMCGSGTTLLAAAASGRRYRGFDRSESAVAIARGRLEGLAKVSLAAG